MLNLIEMDKDIPKSQQIKKLHKVASQICSKINKKLFNDSDVESYTYDITLAKDELGIDEELIYQLIEDYVMQILKSKQLFYNLLQENKLKEFKELAHKNLGVARNLRIEDAQLFLNKMMDSDESEVLKECIDALEACAIKLNADYAFGVLKLIKLKNSL